jgi:hypothetical protein
MILFVLHCKISKAFESIYAYFYKDVFSNIPEPSHCRISKVNVITIILGMKKTLLSIFPSDITKRVMWQLLGLTY